ncbi:MULTISPECIES: ABC transporter ATP-binding protein [unclassified Adlercreutzia]|uniref:ABC transporter ATP-binding protein n=1 Tax=unclassified Adlercreutzia TaxID=2636013 RepID=UPI0013EAC493|nr:MULTISPECIES: ABC transporter ATP-binding protein [unclassified Adlercreutzia]
MSETFATPSAATLGSAAFSRDNYGTGAHAGRGSGRGVGAPILSVRQIEKVFGSRDSVTHALAGVSFDVEAGEFVGIMGPSGSGKTTLLNCVSTIDKPTGGHILVDGRDITGLSKRALAKFRRDDLGFIFQDSNLLDTLTGYENIALALTIKHDAPSSIPARVESIARSLSVEGVLKRYPHQMSGGQRQRVAAARAIVSDPKLVLADEPTGALDSRNAQIMLETLDLMNRDMGATIMMVTHDAFAASFTNRVLFIKDGTLFNEIRRGDMAREQFFNRIMEVIAFLGGDASHAA